MSLLNLLVSPRSTKETFAMRMKVCDTCEFKRSVRTREVCGVCGCPLQRKAALAFEKCPQGKW